MGMEAKLVPPLRCFCGGVLMVAAILIAMVIWIDARSRPNIILPQPPPSICDISPAPACAPAAHDIAEPIPLLRVICVP